MTHDELVTRGARWLRQPHNWVDPGEYRPAHAVVVTELSCCCGEECDVVGFGPHGSTVIECKTSRADFHRDDEKPVRRPGVGAVGKWRYYLVPTGLVRVEEVREGWGLLEASGRQIKVTKRSRMFYGEERQPDYEIAILVSAMARLRPAPDAKLTVKWQGERTRPTKSDVARATVTVEIEEGDST
jgi:hypothetical protein